MDDDKDRLISRLEAVEQQLIELAIRDRSNGLFSVNLTIQQLRTLRLLLVDGGTSTHELADALGVGLATLTGIVDRLERRGLVQRRLDPDDRRVRRIDLTDEGRKLITEFGELGKAQRRRLLRRLDERVLGNLVEAVELLYDAALAEAGGAVAARPRGTRPGG